MNNLTEQDLANLGEFLNHLRNPDYSPNYLTEENQIFKISTASFKDYEDEDGNLITIEQQKNEYLEKSKVIKEKEERKKRNQLLTESDWTQIPNTPLTEEQKNSWEDYRNKLRNITEDPKFPWEHSWPEKP